MEGLVMNSTIFACLLIVFWCGSWVVILVGCYIFYRINRDINATIKRMEDTRDEYLAIAERYRLQRLKFDQQQQRERDKK